MFAPYCPTCGARQLLGFSHIVGSAWERGGAIFLRCWCGTIVDARAQRPPARRITVVPSDAQSAALGRKSLVSADLLSDRHIAS